MKGSSRVKLENLTPPVADRGTRSAAALSIPKVPLKYFISFCETLFYLPKLHRDQIFFKRMTLREKQVIFL